MLTVGDWTTLRLSVFGAPWTVATATLPVETTSGASFELTARGSAHGPFSLTQSTALPGGAVSFVTPMRIASMALSIAARIAATRAVIVGVSKRSAASIACTALKR